MLAAHMAWEDISGKSVSLIPVAEYSASEWNCWLQEQFQKHPKRLIASILRERLPTGFAESFIRHFCSHIRQTFASGISRRDREDIAHLLGNGIPLTLVSRRPGDEFVTAGGVETDEIHPETLESKKHQHLYFVGEILNIDGYT